MGWKHTDPETGRKVVLAPEQIKRALNVHAEASDALYMKMEVLNGTDGEGTDFDLCIAMGSGALILRVELPDGTTRTEVLNTQELVTAWVQSIASQATSGNLSELLYVYEDDGTPAPPPKRG